MKVKITPTKVHGEVTIPASKSYSHRVLIANALATTQIPIHNIAQNDDIVATTEALKLLNVRCNNIDGITTVDCKESGSTLRFLIPIFALFHNKVRYIGKNRLLHRPFGVYEQLFDIAHDTNNSIVVSGRLTPGIYQIPGNVSSQFITGLLFALPLLEGDSCIEIIDKCESRSYILMTIEILSKYNIKIDYVDNKINIPGNQKYAPTVDSITVEGDHSQGAFFKVLSAINNPITIHGLNPDSLQGDKVIEDIIKNPHNVDLADCPDLGPIVCVLQASLKDKSRIYNTERLKYKESDRSAVMVEELSKCGIDIKATDNEILICGGKYHAPIDRNGETMELSGHKDHRIVMSLAILATILDKPVVINEAESVAKSYPEFFDDLASLGVNIEYSNELQIAVPVVETTYDKIIAKVKEISAVPRIDIIELRIDYCDASTDFVRLLQEIRDIISNGNAKISQKKILVTLRTKDEGGMREISKADYIKLYQGILPYVDYIDMQYYFDTSLANIEDYSHKCLVSYHNFQRLPDNLPEILDNMASTNCDIVKAAIMPQSQEDVDKLWKIADDFHAKHDKKLVLIAMGMLGGKTRINAKKLGCFFTFGAYDNSSAPGQVDYRRIIT